MLFLAVLIVASLLVLRMSVGTKGAEWSGFSLDSYAQLFEPYYLKSLVLTLRLALISAVIALCIVAASDSAVSCFAATLRPS